MWTLHKLRSERIMEVKGINSVNVARSVSSNHAVQKNQVAFNGIKSGEIKGFAMELGIEKNPFRKILSPKVALIETKEFAQGLARELGIEKNPLRMVLDLVSRLKTIKLKTIKEGARELGIEKNQ